MSYETVEHPPHYNQGKIEVIDFIEDQNFGFLDGNVIKYICRYRWRGAPIEDLKKARFYLDRLIFILENLDDSGIQEPLRVRHGLDRARLLYDGEGHSG